MGYLRGTSAPSDCATRVLFISDVRLYREALEFSLSRAQGFTLSGHCGVAEALDRLSEKPADVALVDTSTPGGLALGRPIRKRFPAVDILGLAISGDPNHVLECAEAGFSGYLSVDAGIEGLTATMTQMMHGELTCSPRVAGMMFERLATLSAGHSDKRAPALAANGIGRLMTPREAEIALLIEAGLTNKEIALQLGISPATVKNHVHNLLEKLAAPRRSAIGAKLSKPSRITQLDISWKGPTASGASAEG